MTGGDWLPPDPSEEQVAAMTPTVEELARVVGPALAEEARGTAAVPSEERVAEIVLEAVQGDPRVQELAEPLLSPAEALEVAAHYRKEVARLRLELVLGRDGDEEGGRG